MTAFAAELRRLRIEKRWSQQDLADRIHFSLSYVKIVESDHQAPSEKFVKQCAKALAEHLITIAEEDREMRRRTMLAAGVGSLAALLGTPAAASSSKLGLADVQAVNDAARLLTAHDLRSGGGGATAMARSLMSWADTLLSGSMSDSVRPQLLSAVGYMTDRAGQATLDGGDQRSAFNLLDAALRMATEASDPQLAALVRSDTASILSRIGQHRRAATMLEPVLEDPAVCDVLAANARVTAAHVYARLGEHDSSLRHARDAEEVAHHAGDDAPWYARQLFVGPGHVEAAQASIAFTGRRHEEARSRLEAAVARMGDERGRGRAGTYVRLALTTYALGDDDAGQRWTLRAITAARHVESSRVRTALAQLAARVPDTDLAREIHNTI